MPERALRRPVPKKSLFLHPASLQVKLLVIGYSCKNISICSIDPKPFLDADSKTGGGFAALMKYVKYNDELAVIISENVATMCFARSQDQGRRPIDV